MMRTHFHNACGARRSGFSLIEIVVALAVISIGLMAVVGLIPQGLQASRDAADNTVAATIVHDTFNQMRFIASQPSSVWPPTWPAAWYPDAYYDMAGNQVAPLSPTFAVDRYYHVNLNAQLSATLPAQTVIAVVTWPDKGVTVPALNTNYFWTTIANYQH